VRGDQVRIVILGGGFAGISAARELGRRARRDPTIEVHLVSSENYLLFSPLLPEVVSGGIEPSHILNPIRQYCDGVHFHCATVKELNLETRTVTLMGADARRTVPLRFDHLLLALGLTADASRIPGMAQHALPLKTLGDALHLRNHLLTCLEEAEIDFESHRRERRLTVVVIGGGFSGVETAAEVNDMFKAALRFYPRSRISGHRVVLIHSAARILPELDAELGAFAERKLKERGIELLLGRRVAEVTPEGVVLSSGERVAAGTVVGTVGTAPHPVIAEAALPKDRGRVLVEASLQVRGVDRVWAAGDAALVPDVRQGGYCPPTAQYATRQGVQCARNILATLRGGKVRDFAFGGLGQLAVVGHQCGVAKVLGVRLSGFVAWWLWRSVYLMKAPGLRCKLRVGLDWVLHALFPRDITKLDMARGNALARAHYSVGEVIFRQGELGDHFYLIESGTVEILLGLPGDPERRLGVRGPGESFGELALLHNTPRSATVRCLTSVDVLALSRQDFLAVLGSSAALRSHMEQDAGRYVSPP
jgi:NADH dehydrogenase